MNELISVHCWNLLPLSKVRNHWPDSWNQQSSQFARGYLWRTCSKNMRHFLVFSCHLFYDSVNQNDILLQIFHQMINQKYEKNLFYHFQSKICRYKIGKQKKKIKNQFLMGLWKISSIYLRIVFCLQKLCRINETMTSLIKN